MYHNFISEPLDIWMNDQYGKRINMKLLAEFDDMEDVLTENEMLSYGMFVESGSASVFVGRLLFPWMKEWKYEGEYFDEIDLKEIGKQIYYWVGLWD